MKRQKAAHIQNVKLSGRQSSQGGIRESAEVQSKSNVKYAMLGTLSGMPPHDLMNYPYAEANAKLPSTFLIFLWCLRLVWFPHPLSYDYSYKQIPAASFSSPFVILGILLAVALGYFSFRRPLKRSPIVFGMQVFCVTLAPAMAFVLLRGGTIELSFQRTSRLPRIADRRGGIMEASSSI